MGVLNSAAAQGLVPSGLSLHVGLKQMTSEVRPSSEGQDHTSFDGESRRVPEIC